MCYRLHIKCPSKVHTLRPWSQSMALSEDDRSFSVLGLMGRDLGHWGVLKRELENLSLLLSFLTKKSRSPWHEWLPSVA